MTPISSRILLAAALACVPLLPSCRLLDPEPDYEIARPMAITPQKFLHNDNEQLNEWLDQTIVVRISRVPLSKTFDEPEFTPMSYKAIDLPEDDPQINIDSVGMSRRQLLWAISHEHSLEMTPVPGYGSEKSYIEIRGRQIEE